MPSIWLPEQFLKKSLPKGFFKNKILTKDLNVKRVYLRALLTASKINKTDLKNTIYKVVKQYQEKLEKLKEEGVEGYRKKALNGEILLKDRVENLLKYSEIERLKKEHEGQYYRWLPSASKEPDPQHQLLYGKVFKVGEGDKNGNMPSERYGCKCGIQFLGEAKPVDLTKKQIKKVEKQVQEEKPIKVIEKTIKNNDLTRKLGEKVYNRSMEILNKAKSQDVKKLWAKYEDRLTIVTTANRGTAFYSPNKGVSINIDKDVNANKWRKEYTSFFHEFGHHIDGLGQLDKNGVLLDKLYSAEYKGGIFGKTIKEEIQNRVKAIDKELKEFIKDHANDLEALHDKKIIGDFSYSLYKRNGIPPKINYDKSIAYETLGREIRSIGGSEYSSLSDLAGGATGNRVNAGIGHSKAYWKRSESLAHEGFAEMYSASITNLEEYAVLKKYLPKSVEIFEEIVKDLLK